MYNVIVQIRCKYLRSRVNTEYDGLARAVEHEWVVTIIFCHLKNNRVKEIR